MTSGGSEGFRLRHLAITAAGDRLEPGTDPNHLAAVLEFEVPANSPLFEGHFPGHPIFPGVAHLALLRHALLALRASPHGATLGREDTEFGIVGVHNLRLRQPVLPGDGLSLHLSAVDHLAFRFDLRRADILVSQGEVRLATHTSSAQPSTTPCHAAGGAFPRPAELLPHAPPARLIDEVEAASAREITCRASLSDRYPLAAAGAVPGFLALELGAQAAACLEGLRRTGDRSPGIGYLVGVRRAALPLTLPCATALRVRANLLGGAGSLAQYEVEVRWGGDTAPGLADQPLATGALSTFLPAAS